MRTSCKHRKVPSVPCGDLYGKEIQKGGDICASLAASLCCRVETNTTLGSNSAPIKINKQTKPTKLIHSLLCQATC